MDTMNINAASGTAIRQDPSTLYKFMLVGLLAAVLYTSIITAAYASASPMGAVMCQIVYFIFGNLGRGLAVIAVVFVGAGATIGKVSWGMALTTAVGISVIFGSGTIAIYLINAAAGASLTSIC